jgi:mycothiol synthase
MEIFFRRCFDKLKRIIKAVFENSMTEEDLRMHLPVSCVFSFSEELPIGYTLRQYKNNDYLTYQKLMFSSGMGYCPLDYWTPKIIPEGFFVIEYEPKKMIVAACFASEVMLKDVGMIGSLGWLACHPNHRGLRLGELLARKVSEKLIDHGLQLNLLGTQDFRLGAINLYLQLGWQSYVESVAEKMRWKVIFNKLKELDR